MSTYERKLTDFVQGKRLLRLPRPVRDRAEAFCDACGSSQPRTLYALKDLESERYYFVGDTCLKELAKRGAVLRRYGRESGQKAYATEMQRRTQEREKESTTSTSDGAGASATKPELNHSADDGNSTRATDIRSLFPVVLIIETPKHYRTFVSILSARDMTHNWGFAQETRYEEVWRVGGEGGLLLEEVKEERQDALGLCLTKAWEEAISSFKGPEPVPLILNGTEKDHQERSLAEPLQALLRLATKVQVDSHHLANSRNGDSIATAVAASSR